MKHILSILFVALLVVFTATSCNNNCKKEGGECCSHKKEHCSKGDACCDKCDGTCTPEDKCCDKCPEGKDGQTCCSGGKEKSDSTAATTTPTTDSATAVTE